jgi:hypothetical protein
MNQITVFKGRTKVVPVSLGVDVSQDTITSEIRMDKDPESTLIAEWVVTNVTDGVDGEILLTLDNSVSEQISQSKGYMDIKRVTGGEPVAVFDEPLEVLFKNVVTV